MPSYTIEVEKTVHTNVPGKFLGRHVRHDSRNRQYQWVRRESRPLTSQLHVRHIPILDQGETSACTGNMETGALGSDPCWAALPVPVPPLNEVFAQSVLYSGAETLDGDGPFPQNDVGSSGPSVAQVAKNLGFISGYLHCFSFADFLDALEDHPVGVGSNWYDSMDEPDSSDLVSVSPNAVIRGGHEYLSRGKDVDSKLVFFDQSWGLAWGKQGTFAMTYATVERLLGEQGDATVSLPLTSLPPAPVPVAPKAAVRSPEDLALYNRTWEFAAAEHPLSGSARQVARDLSTWYTAKGLA